MMEFLTWKVRLTITLYIHFMIHFMRCLRIHLRSTDQFAFLRAASLASWGLCYWKFCWWGTVVVCLSSCPLFYSSLTMTPVSIVSVECFQMGYSYASAMDLDSVLHRSQCRVCCTQVENFILSHLGFACSFLFQPVAKRMHYLLFYDLKLWWIYICF